MATACFSDRPLSTEDLRAIAKDATIWGFPLVDNYRIQYAYSRTNTAPSTRAPGTRSPTPPRPGRRTPTPRTPSSAPTSGSSPSSSPSPPSTPAATTRSSSSTPTPSTSPTGSRTTGNGAGTFLLAGPRWKGDAPAGTAQAFVIYRTQLFGSADLDNVKKIQAGYKVEPLSAFLGTPPPSPAPAIDFPKPLTAEAQHTDPAFFSRRWRGGGGSRS